MDIICETSVKNYSTVRFYSVISNYNDILFAVQRKINTDKSNGITQIYSYLKKSKLLYFSIYEYYEFQTILGSYSSLSLFPKTRFLLKRNLQINFKHWDIPLYKGILGSRNIEYEIYKDILE